MRTTLNLDDHLVEEAKALAVKTKRTLTQVIEEALRDTLLRQLEAPDQAPFRMVTFGGTGTKAGVLPGIDLDKTSELLEF